jgi:hypothetical protein
MFDELFQELSKTEQLQKAINEKLGKGQQVFIFKNGQYEKVSNASL